MFLETFLVGRFVTFVLVLSRVSGVVMTAPLFGAPGIPLRVRAMLALALALLITPLQADAAVADNPLEIARSMTSEVLVGLLLGLGLNMLFAGVEVTGQIVSQMSGMSLADVFNPNFDDNASVFSQMFFFLTLAVFVALGGHRMVLEALLETYQQSPPGQAAIGYTFVEAITTIVTQSFLLGIRAAAPILTALLLSTIVLGLISRTLPQINIIMVGFNLNAILTLGALLVTLGGIAWTFQEPVADVLTRLLEVVHSDSLGMEGNTGG